MGRMGSDLNSRRTLRHRQHLQLPETRLHLFCKSSLGSPTDLSWSHGYRYCEILLRLHASSLRVRMWDEPTPLVINLCLRFNQRQF